MQTPGIHSRRARLCVGGSTAGYRKRIVPGSTGRRVFDILTTQLSARIQPGLARPTVAPSSRREPPADITRRISLSTTETTWSAGTVPTAAPCTFAILVGGVQTPCLESLFGYLEFPCVWSRALERNRGPQQTVSRRSIFFGWDPATTLLLAQWITGGCAKSAKWADIGIRCVIVSARSGQRLWLTEHLTITAALPGLPYLYMRKPAYPTHHLQVVHPQFGGPTPVPKANQAT